MSFYRSVIATVAALGLASMAFADDMNTNQNATNDNQPTQLSANDMSNDQSSMQQQNADQPKININTATSKELMQIQGLTSSKAKAIVSYRKKHGEFQSLDDLKKVKGFKNIDPNTLQQIQDQLTTTS